MIKIINKQFKKQLNNQVRTHVNEQRKKRINEQLNKKLVRNWMRLQDFEKNVNRKGYFTNEWKIKKIK